ncbi:hypothetical protein BURK2_01403 [Burkholderiales bacterium]|nr:MAG: hypothetical protein F9K47_09855 [Burkholderiales bacterium]CAG0972962.1 hypothetical protein BURK2_01403 [Burkholderiales bacterium]
MSRFLFAVTALLLLGSTSAHALVQRAYVSALTGNDSNTATDCQATAPCRWFAGAISVVSSGGEIVAMDSGAYGTVTITKSIAIVGAPGVYSGITVFSGHGITIATAGVNVVLRGLTINSLGSSGSGIYMTAGNSLVVQNCVVTNFSSSSGVYVTGATQVRLLDSLLRGNGHGARFSNGPSVLVSNSRLVDNTYGLYAWASGAGVETKVQVFRSEASGNVGIGYDALAASSGQVELHVKDSVASRNGSGVYAYSSGGVALVSVTGSLISSNTAYGLAAENSGAKLVASGNTVTHNNFGLVQISTDVLESAGDNLVRENVTLNTVGTITTIGKL